MNPEVKNGDEPVKVSPRFTNFWIYGLEESQYKRFKTWTDRYGYGRMAIAITRLLDLADYVNGVNAVWDKITELEDRLAKMEKEGKPTGEIVTMGGNKLGRTL